MRKNFLFGLVVSILLLSVNASAYPTITVSGRAYESSNPAQGVYQVHIDVVSGGGQLCDGWSGGLVAITNGLGYYSFEAPIYCSFIIFPSKKSRTFTPSYVFVNGGIGPYDDVDFAAD
jgi:hypothetical protein